MTEATKVEGLDEAIAAAELDDDEAAKVRELVAGGGNPTAAIEFVIGERDAPDEDPDLEPAPAAPPAPTFEVNPKKVEQEIGRHLEAMSELLGPAAEQYEPCEECGGAGVVIPGPKMKGHEMYRACPTCDGHAYVLTGSKDPQWAKQPCPGCAGRGFQTKTPDAAPANGGAAPVIERGEGYGTESWMGNPDIQPATAGGGWQ